MNASGRNSLAIDPSTGVIAPAAASVAARYTSSRPTSIAVACTARRSATSGIVERARRRGPRRDLADESVGLAPVRAVALVHQRRVHHRPAGVDLTDAARVGHAHVGVEGDVGALTAERVHRRDLDAGCVHRHEEHREALVLGLLGIRAGQQEDVVRLVGHRREHLLPVDRPTRRRPAPLASARRQRPTPHPARCSRGSTTHRRRGCGGRSSFVGRRCRGERASPPPSTRCPCCRPGRPAVQLLHQRCHLDRAAPAAADLVGPAGGEVAACGDRLVQRRVVHRAGRVRAFDDVVGEVLVEEGAHLGSERLGLRIEVTVESGASVAPQAAARSRAAAVGGHRARARHAFARRTYSCTSYSSMKP